MHALSTISSVVGRYGKPKSIGCDIRYSCSLLNHGSSSAKNQDGKTPKLKMCTTSEPMLNIGKNPRMFRQNRFLESKKKYPTRKLFCRPSETMLSETYAHPAASPLAQEGGSSGAHYTINIFVNSPSSSENEKTYSCTQQTLGDFSVDKLTQNITSSHAMIEQFFKNKEFDKNYLEERMQKFWKELFESSKANLDGPSPAEDRKTEESFGAQSIVLPSKEKPETVYSNLRKKEQDVEESVRPSPNFIKEEHKPIYANKFFKSDEPPVQVEPSSVAIKEILETETKKKEEEQTDKQDAIFEEIPYYHKWTYDTRTVKATRICSPDNRTERLTHDNDEVTNKVHNLVRLATVGKKPEGRLSKFVSYCKALIQKEADKDVDDEVLETKSNFQYHPGSNKLGPCYDTRRRFSVQHNQSTNYYGKRDYSNRKQFFRKRKPRKSSKDVIRSFERSRHCLAGAAIEKEKKPRARANTDDQKKTPKGTNLAKNASKGHFSKKLTKMDFSKHCKPKSKASAAPSSKNSKGSPASETSKQQAKSKKTKDGYKAPYNSAESVFNENKQLRGYKSETNLSRASTTELHVHPRSKSDLSLANYSEKTSSSPRQHSLLPNLIESCDELPKTEYINEDILLRSDDAVPGDVRFDADGVIQVEKEKKIDGKTIAGDEDRAPGAPPPPADGHKKPPDQESYTTKILRKSKRKRKNNFRDIQERTPDGKGPGEISTRGRDGKQCESASLKDEVAKMEETVQILEEEVSKFEQCMKHDDDDEDAAPKPAPRMMDSPSRIAVDNFEKRYLTPLEDDVGKKETKPSKLKTPSYAGKTLSKKYDENTAKVLGKFSYTDFRAQKQKEERVRAVRRSIPEKSVGAVGVRTEEKKRAKSQTVLSVAKKRQPKRVPPKSEEVRSQVAGKKAAPKLMKLGSFVVDGRKEPKENRVKKAYSVHGTDLKKKLDEKSKGDSTSYKLTRSTTIDLSKPISVRKMAKKTDTAKKTTAVEKKSDMQVRKKAAFADLKKKSAADERPANRDVSNVLKKRESCLLKKIEEHVQKIKKCNGSLDLQKVDTKTRIPTRTRTMATLKDYPIPLKRDAISLKKEEYRSMSSSPLVGSTTASQLRKLAKINDKYNKVKAYAYGSHARSHVALANRTMATSASKLRRPKTSDSSLSAAAAAPQQRRSMSTSGEDDKRPDACFPARKKAKKAQKPQYGGSAKKLAKRSGDGPAQPLEYSPLEKRADDSKIEPAVPKQDITKDIEPMMDSSNQEQLKEYYGQGGYANCEYFKYTRSTFYDLNQFMLAKRLPQPSSGAKPK